MLWPNGIARSAFDARSPLSFPVGRAPGFNPTHPAAQGMSGLLGGSFIPVGKGVYQHALVPNKLLKLSGTTVTGVSAQIGPFFTASGFVVSSGFVSNNSPGRTWGIICIFTAPVNSNFFLDGGTNGWQVGIGGSNLQFNIGSGAATIVAAQPIVPNTPYFIAASAYSAVGYAMVILNLATGVIQSQSGTTAASFTSGGTSISFGTQTGCQYGPAVYSPIYLSLQQLLAWAADPWSFWYSPSSPIQIASPSIVPSAAPSPPVTAGASIIGAKSVYPWPNRLAYPVGRRPGFDPAHPAAANCLLSCIPSVGGNMVNLLSGSPGVVGSTNGVISLAGPAINVPVSTFDSVQFPFPTTTFKHYTAAAVVTWGGAASAGFQNNIFQGGTTNFGFLFGMGVFNNAGNVGQLNVGFYNVVNLISPIKVPANVPSFVWASVTNTGGTSYTASFLILNLATGALQVATTTGSFSPNSGNGTGLIGNATNATFSFGGYIHAIAISASLNAFGSVSLATGELWSADPWSFWYPLNALYPVTQPGVLFAGAGGPTPPPGGGSFTVSGPDVACNYGVSGVGTRFGLLNSVSYTYDRISYRTA